MNSLNDYFEEYRSLRVKKNLEGLEALRAVRQEGYALQYVKTQTPEICLEAVRQNGYALQWVKTQTPEICLEAVRQNSYALQYVEPEMFSKVKELTVSEIEKLLGYSVKIVK